MNQFDQSRFNKPPAAFWAMVILSLIFFTMIFLTSGCSVDIGTNARFGRLSIGYTFPDITNTPSIK